MTFSKQTNDSSRSVKRTPLPFPNQRHILKTVIKKSEKPSTDLSRKRKADQKLKHSEIQLRAVVLWLCHHGSRNRSSRVYRCLSPQEALAVSSHSDFRRSDSAPDRGVLSSQSCPVLANREARLSRTNRYHRHHESSLGSIALHSAS
jgi:hypothetical protein